MWSIYVFNGDWRSGSARMTSHALTRPELGALACRQRPACATVPRRPACPQQQRDAPSSPSHRALQGPSCCKGSTSQAAASAGARASSGWCACACACVCTCMCALHSRVHRRAQNAAIASAASGAAAPPRRPVAAPLCPAMPSTTPMLQGITSAAATLLLLAVRFPSWGGMCCVPAWRQSDWEGRRSEPPGALPPRWLPPWRCCWPGMHVAAAAGPLGAPGAPCLSPSTSHDTMRPWRGAGEAAGDDDTLSRLSAEAAYYAADFTAEERREGLHASVLAFAAGGCGPRVSAAGRCGQAGATAGGGELCACLCGPCTTQPAAPPLAPRRIQVATWAATWRGSPEARSSGCCCCRGGGGSRRRVRRPARQRQQQWPGALVTSQRSSWRVWQGPDTRLVLLLGTGRRCNASPPNYWCQPAGGLGGLQKVLQKGWKTGGNGERSRRNQKWCS